MHKLQWRYESRPDLGVLALAGQPGAKNVPQLNSAIGLTLFPCSGPLILDLSALYRWTAPGQNAIVKAAARLHAAGRTLDIAAAPGSDTSVISSASPAIRTHIALHDALQVHSAAAGRSGDQRE